MRPPHVNSISIEDQYRVLVDGIEDYAIFMLDPAGRVVSWNRGAERIKGYRSEEIIGQHFSRFYSAADVAARKPWKGLEVARAEGRCEDEGWRIRRDGSRLWASVVITALHDDTGNLVGFLQKPFSALALAMRVREVLDG
jgi:PAS domain S-box-containing protein